MRFRQEVEKVSRTDVEVNKTTPTRDPGGCCFVSDYLLCIRARALPCLSFLFLSTASKLKSEDSMKNRTDYESSIPPCAHIMRVIILMNTNEGGLS